MTTITWSVPHMTCVNALNGFSNVVINALWECRVEKDGLTHIDSAICDFAVVGDTFTPYEQLTQEQVLGWMWALGVDKTSVEAAALQTLQSMQEPATVNLPLPWSSNP